MRDVRFYFDPICPWCWITSRWLVEEVQPHRDIDIDFRSISLAIRNEALDMDEKRAERYRRTLEMLRVVEALRDDGRAEAVGDLYTDYGRRIHHDKDLRFDVADALEAAGLDRSYADAASDEHWDAPVRASTKDAEEMAGDDVGTPIVAYRVDGEWKGYFGPVIPEIVRGDAALRLWDGLSLLIATDGFYEIKKTRTIGPQLPVR